MVVNNIKPLIVFNKSKAFYYILKEDGKLESIATFIKFYKPS